MFDQAGRPKAFGAETTDEEVIMNGEQECWVKSEWYVSTISLASSFLITRRWKLHMRPAHLPMIRNLDLQPLPARIGVDDIFSYFFGYVKDQLKEYITSQFGAGGNIWAALYPTMYVVLSTPNGWEGAQQQRMRAAAIRAGLVDKEGARRVRFVTEAEVGDQLYHYVEACASSIYCLRFRPQSSMQ